jgi:hypothetical protein
MRRSTSAAIALTLALAACGGASTSDAPAPAGMSISMPSAAATVVTADTITVEIDTGVMGTLEMQIKSGATLALSFAEDPAGFKTTVTYEALDASMDVPMQGTMRADESDVTGSLGFTVSPRGHVNVTDRFDITGPAGQAVGNVSLAYQLFPRLPADAPGVGDTWVDTLTFEEEIEGATSVNTSIVEYTITGDTTVAGRSLLVISTSSIDERTSAGEMQGMSMTQVLSGRSTGSLLWDPAASLVYESKAASEMSGTMTVDMPGVPEMNLSMSGRHRTTLGGD